MRHLLAFHLFTLVREPRAAVTTGRARALVVVTVVDRTPPEPVGGDACDDQEQQDPLQHWVAFRSAECHSEQHRVEHVPTTRLDVAHNRIVDHIRPAVTRG